jgi:hypothetical protein
MQEESKVLNISFRKKKVTKDKSIDICMKIAELSQTIHDLTDVPSDLQLHFCTELSMMIDYFKKKLE